MINYFIFTLVPAFFVKAYKKMCDSATFTFLGKIWHAIKLKIAQSNIGHILGEKETDSQKTKTSIFCYIVDGVVSLIVKVFRAIIKALTLGSFSCILARVWNKLKSLYRFLDFEFICGLSIMVVFLCPGEKWHNIYGLAISLVLLFMLLVLAATKKKEVLKMSTLGVAFLVFMFTAVFGVLVASDRGDASRVFVFFATSFVFSIILAADIDSVSVLKKILGFVFVAVVLTSIYAIYQRYIGVEPDASLTDLATNAGMPGRVFSTFENPNNYAEFLVLTFPMSVAYCSMIKEKHVRFFAFIMCIFPMIALLMTYSRSCWVSFAITAFIFMFLYNKKLIPVCVLLVLLAIPFLPQTILARMGTIGSTRDSSNMYRIYIWDGVLRMLKKYWATGVGLGPSNFRAIYLPLCVAKASPAPHSHMLFLEIWVEQGILGILAYIGMFFSVIRRSLISLKYASKEVRITLIAGISSLCGIMFACTAEYIWYYPRVMVVYFMMLGIMYGCIKLAKNQKQSKLKDLHNQ